MYRRIEDICPLIKFRKVVFPNKGEAFKLQGHCRREMNMDEPKKIVIVGGGISGLSAAWYLNTHINQSISVNIIEAEEKLGGKLSTRIVDLGKGERLIIDGGAESFVTRKPEAWMLAEELGLQDSVLNPGSETRNMYVLDGGEPIKLPLSPLAFVRSGLLTWKEKFRMLQEPFIPAKRDDEDESLAAFVTRRLGRAALDKMIGPVLAGIYNTDPETQSILTTSPVMREMEKEYGGLVKGAFGRMREKRKAQDPNMPKPPQFMTFDEGAQVMVDALVNQLQFDIRTKTRVLEVNKNNGHYQVVLSAGEPLSADAVIFACPANASSEILRYIAPESATLLHQIRHANIGTVSLVYRSEQIKMPFELNGLMIPRREKRRIDAVTWTSAKPIKRAPAGYEMVRVFFGGGDPSVAELEEEEIVAVAREELKTILGIEAEPVHREVFRWLNSFPQADVGHLDLVDMIEGQLPEGIFLAGSSYRGIGVPDCIRQGYDAAEFCLQFLEAL